MINLPAISEPKKNPNPNLYNLSIGLYHQSCAFWGMGLDGYFLLLWDFKEWVFYKRVGKDNILMHAFLLHSLSFLFTSLFPFSLLFHF